jgi:hypothetical protein
VTEELDPQLKCPGPLFPYRKIGKVAFYSPVTPFLRRRARRFSQAIRSSGLGGSALDHHFFDLEGLRNALLARVGRRAMHGET